VNTVQTESSTTTSFPESSDHGQTGTSVSNTKSLEETSTSGLTLGESIIFFNDPLALTVITLPSFLPLTVNITWLQKSNHGQTGTSVSNTKSLEETSRK
jgi:hypothetical protein